MRYLTFICILLLTLFFLSTTPSNANRMWEPGNGIPLRQGHHIEFEGSSAIDEDGNLCVIWSEARHGFGAIYAQLFDHEGDPQWDEDGVPVAENSYLFLPPDIVSSGDGGWILAWIDYCEEDGNVFL
ncbi:MAG: hypothetical protein P9L92_02775 [Candidatus Electryonea clarkiae]|nr:hypothetical protein [Candidatus Electryonea clarkiae]MDP8287687.1 hypothetical protein [Candidatus Electryonea clarkiae]